MESKNTMIQDDILFEETPDKDGWISKINTHKGEISVRFGGRGTLSNDKSLYEVWYPDEDNPIGDQTADNIWDYFNKLHYEFMNKWK